MDLVIKNITGKDLELFQQLTRRLGLKSVPLLSEAEEDLALGFAINKGLESGFVAEEKVMKLIRRKSK